MNETPLISVIITTYNQKQYLNETLDSIFFQKYSNIEIVIQDDFSNAFDSKYFIKYISENNKGNITNVIINHNEINLGTVKNINLGITTSNGQYIKIIAGDDAFYDSDVFEKQIMYLSTH